MKIIKALFVSIGLMTLAGSCTSEFDEMNVSPNDPTAISPQYLLPYALEASVDRYWGVRTRFERLNLDGAMCWMQYLTRNIYSNEGDNYEVSVGFYTNNWKGFFNDAQVNYQRIITLAGPGGQFENANYEGVALVMRSWVFSLLADVYGPIPYTEALKGTAESPNYTPVYDPVETVYAGLLKDLKTANEKLSVTGPAIAGDILYGGDILKWKKFANSLRLRLANRQAVKKSAESKAVMAEILGNATIYPVFTSNADNAKLTNSAVLPSNNEWHQVMIQDGRTDWNISKTLADRLNELGDSRITVYAQPNKAGKYEGHANGLPDAVATAYLGTSSLLGTYFTAPTAPAVIMTFSELNLILAEAAADGDITGSAQTYLEKGITASFEQYGLTVPAGYLAKVGTATKTTIMEQKWISLFGQAIEAWTEYRRTGLPVLPAKDSRSVFSNDGVLPTRLKYPTSEYSLNKVSLDKGISLLGGADDMKSKLWWVEK
ncbi:SusD/RagB family nutrient-binding outer membrane lipoprotein [Larkinella punicea]|uniref:SusD/RagB family nutrient-binding outer membrane lipoprotein n=1 Tax=Larkinella punicea TaxID=2315727 RepID=A0A368JM83_9BACT|nr:SusD/RagB family nutrient-binding outer membrane lipoprotein [Larkinella punicea]RCR68757.1 SusD/RagB family nutrient-binding outer membrane lipoprotein [Larkinella punicea]